MKKPAVLLCKCRSEHFINIDYQEIENYLSALAADFLIVDDLCAAALTNAPELNALAESYGPILVLACQPRAVKSLFAQYDIGLQGTSAINFRDNGFRSVVDALKPFNLEAGAAGRKSIVSGLGVPSWFPVIDQEKCTGCGHCAAYCLFGVYRFDDPKVTVQQPLNCKNNCPACARSCPASAVIFPKIKEGGVISGAEPGNEQQGNNVIPGSMAARLAEHRGLRSSILKPSVMQQAEKERDQALQQVQDSLKNQHD